MLRRHLEVLTKTIILVRLETRIFSFAIVTSKIIASWQKNISVFAIKTNNQNHSGKNHNENFNPFSSLITIGLVSWWTSSKIFCCLKISNTILFRLSLLRYKYGAFYFFIQYSYCYQVGKYVLPRDCLFLKTS